MKKKEKRLKGRRKEKTLKWPGNKNIHLDEISDSTSGKLLTWTSFQVTILSSPVNLGIFVSLPLISLFCMIAQNVKIYPGEILGKTLSSIMYIAASVYLPHQAMTITEA